MRCSTSKSWQRDSNKSASDELRAVQTEMSVMKKFNAPKPIAIFDPELDFSIETLDVGEQLYQLAGNTGNMLFHAPLRNQIKHSFRIKEFHVKNTRIRTIVLSLGNCISPATDMGDFARVIEDSAIDHVVAIGLGAQAQAGIDEVQLKPGTRRFLDVISERSKSIGVRGEFTGAVLERLGIKNFDIIGCPSVFMFGGEFRTIDPVDGVRLSVNTTWHGHYRDGIAELLSFGMKNDALFVEQSYFELLSFTKNKEVSQIVDFTSRYYTHDAVSGWNAIDWLRRRMVYYTKLQDWKAAMNNIDISIGSRFHGAVVSILMGARALLLTMDTRTLELAEFFNIPHMPLQDFDSSNSLEYYYKKSDPTRFLSTFTKRRIEYQNFLLKNGLRLDPGFSLSSYSRTAAEVRSEEENHNADDNPIGVRKAPKDVNQYPGNQKPETTLSLASLRSLEDGANIEKSEFVVPRAEANGHHPQKTRISWRSRQGVLAEYTHQPMQDIYYCKDSDANGIDAVYASASRLAQMNNFNSVTNCDLENNGLLLECFINHFSSKYQLNVVSLGTSIRPELFYTDLIILTNVFEFIKEPDFLLQALAASSARCFVISTRALEVYADKGASSRLGPPSDKRKMFEWSTTEFQNLVANHLKIVSHTIVSLEEAVQMVVAIRKDDRDVDFAV